MGTTSNWQMFTYITMPFLILPSLHKYVICILGSYYIHRLLQTLQSHLAKGERRNHCDVYYEKPLAF